MNVRMSGIQNELHRLSGIDGDPLLKEIAQSMLEKYEKYWGDIENMNLMTFIAVVLDLRYMMKYLKYWFNKWYSKEMAEFALKLVRDALDSLYATMQRVPNSQVLVAMGKPLMLVLQKNQVLVFHMIHGRVLHMSSKNT